MKNIGKDLEKILTKGFKEGMAESHYSSYFKRHHGMRKDELESDLVGHDPSLEIENMESELNRELEDKEKIYLIEVFNKAIVDNGAFVDYILVGWYDTLRDLNVK